MDPDVSRSVDKLSCVLVVLPASNGSACQSIGVPRVEVGKCQFGKDSDRSSSLWVCVLVTGLAVCRQYNGSRGPNASRRHGTPYDGDSPFAGAEVETGIDKLVASLLVDVRKYEKKRLGSLVDKHKAAREALQESRRPFHDRSSRP